VYTIWWLIYYVICQVKKMFAMKLHVTEQKGSNPKARFEDIHPKEHIADMTTISSSSSVVSCSFWIYCCLCWELSSICARFRMFCCIASIPRNVDSWDLHLPWQFGPSSFRNDMKLALVVILPQLVSEFYYFMNHLVSRFCPAIYLEPKHPFPFLSFVRKSM